MVREEKKWSVLLLASEEVKREGEWLVLLFMLSRGGDPGRMALVILTG